MRGRFGHGSAITDENEITQPHRPLPEDTQARPAVPEPAPRPRASGGPPPGLARDVWPWLAALAALALAGLLLWVFLANRDSGGGPTVPAVVGLQQQEAIAKLTGRGFNVRAVVRPSRKPEGIVFAQSPGGGSRLDKGQTVDIEVSNGRAVSTRTTKQTTTAKQTTTSAAPATAPVPAVTGQTAAAGAGQVEAAGFVAETAPVDEAGAPGAIVAQDPAPGGQVEAGSVVRLSVATGGDRSEQEVPDVVGQGGSAARAALLGASLTARTEYRDGRPGVVLAQEPAAGAAEPAWTQVTIVVGR